MKVRIVMGLLSVGIAGGLLGWAVAPRATTLSTGPGSAASLGFRTVDLRVDDCTKPDGGTIHKSPEELWIKRDRKVAWIIHGRKKGDGIRWKIIDDNGGKKDWFKNNGKDPEVSGSTGNQVNDAYFTDVPALPKSLKCPANVIGGHPCDWSYKVEVWRTPATGKEFRCAFVDPKIKIRDYG